MVAMKELWEFLKGVTDALVQRPVLSIPVVTVILAILYFLYIIKKEAL